MDYGESKIGYCDYIERLQSEVDILKCIKEFENIRERIYVRLMNPLICRKTTENLESVPFLDLSVTFVLDISDLTHAADNRNERDVKAGFHPLIRVTEDLAESWNVRGTDLLSIALENERRDNSFISEELADTLRRMCSEEPNVLEKINMIEAGNTGPDRLVIYSLYEESFRNGSSALLRNEVLREVAEKAGRDILIIPSSVNELLCIADMGDMDFIWLRSVIGEVNDTIVPRNEILSYSVYRYSLKNDRISVAA